jgi:hypothetical protein
MHGVPGWRATSVALVCLLVAGCSGDAPAAAAATTSSSADGDTGSVAGTVVNEELQPVEGAAVGLADDVKVRTMTDRVGAFLLDGLLPGPQKLLVQKDGYEPQTISVTIVVGEPATAKVTIKAIPVVPTRQVSQIYAGYIGADLALPQGNQYAQGTQGASRRSVYYNIEQPNLIGVVAGMKWQSGAPVISDRMYLLVYLNFPPDQCDDAARPYCLPMATAEGKTPLVAGSNDYQQSMGDRQDLKINVRFKMRSCLRGDIGPGWTDTSRCNQPTEVVQLGVEQRVDVYTTLFYGSAAPDGYKPFPA